MPEESGTPDFARLVADLKLLREKGLTRLRRINVPALEEATRRCRPNSSASAQPAIEELLRSAVSGIGGGFLGEAAEYTFGLVSGTRAWPAQQRRRKAAEICGVTTDHFRKSYEITILEQVAEEMIASIERSPTPSGGEPKAPAAGDTPDTGHIVMRTVVGDAVFVERLAEATSATIVDPTHEDLADHLERALARKRRRSGPAAFWEELRIVFLNDDLLGLVRDDLTVQFPDAAEAARERRQRAGLARRTVTSLLLRLGTPGRWSVHSYAGLVQFPGAVLRTADGHNLVHLTGARSHRTGPEMLRFEFEDRPDHYFESVFQEVVENSREEHEVVLVGSPTEAGFACSGARFRRGVMIPQQNIHDWLPAVVIITWRRKAGTIEPLLEINTPKNSTRELGKASHLSGYVNQRDHVTQDSANSTAPNFLIGPATAKAAVLRELRDELRVTELPREPRLTSTPGFYYPDKENLFFYVFEVEIPAETRFAPSTHMYPWSVEEVLQVREHQVVNNTILALTEDGLTRGQRRMALTIAGLNLTVHGHDDLARRVSEQSRQDELDRRLVEELTELAARSRFSRYAAGRELSIEGLAGLQYRNFFTDVLPVYAQVGVPSAAKILASLHADPARSRAIGRLAASYGDEQLITALPIEV
ncbi:hypothetical protein AB0L00_27390 [Actinoallomurus sp. NPDC052308]|uniref:hypothetical protein n=1 Tax=Actinoallomurus sp. NPDC052308 TaxID=3155530 RepID=UPI0034219B6A